MGRRTLAVVCPVYNEQQAIPLFFARIKEVFRKLPERYQARLYFIDNGCTDDSLDVIREINKEHPNVFVIVLSRNFGYQAAMETGLRLAEGDFYVMIDVDCEDPPEMIPEFLAYAEQGYDIVYGERLDRPEAVLLKSARRLFYRILKGVADDNSIMNMAEFSLLTAEVRNAILEDSTSYPFLRSSIGRIGFRRKNIPYKRQERIFGKSHYNLVSMTIFAVGGLLSASTLALRLPAYSLPFWVLAMILVTVNAIVSPAAWQIPLLLFLGSMFTGFSVVATGLYVARIYKNGLNRPNAIVRYQLSLLPQSETDELLRSAEASVSKRSLR
ncbi:MAG TPA: glycosyltransferase family 2 protein [Bryobacteraceae bacterium]|jgi:glycosyltransferase involved in cell wall biosynthesis|nr:glycosyltransferase family 2 protein [Bryobacteraceae bacterium]